MSDLQNRRLLRPHGPSRSKAEAYATLIWGGEQ